MFDELDDRLDHVESVIRERLADGRGVTTRVRLVGVGRAASNDIVVDKPVVSRRHAQVRATARTTDQTTDLRLELRDLGSANDSVVRRGDDRFALAPGDWFELRPGDEIVTLGDERLLAVAGSGMR